MLSRPTFAIWLLSTLLAVVVILTNYTTVTVPVLSPLVAGHAFDTLLIAYALLWLGTVVSGL